MQLYEQTYFFPRNEQVYDFFEVTNYFQPSAELKVNERFEYRYQLSKQKKTNLTLANLI